MPRLRPRNVIPVSNYSVNGEQPMSRQVLTVMVAAGLLLAACGGTEVVVQAQIEGQDGPVALRDLPVRAVPYDRDAIFDSLRAAYTEPEPEIPQELMVLQDSIARAQEEWRVAETRWGAGGTACGRSGARWTV
jgi:hypothetical protein